MLKVVDVDKALEILKNHFSPYEKYEEVKTEEVSGRILVCDIYSDENIPAFDRSVVDGFALGSKDTLGASENIPAMLKIKGEILMGEKPVEGISRGECMKISTGGMLPQGADSVIMCEYTEEGFDSMCLCLRSTAHGENVSKKGDDIKKGEVVLKKGSLLSSAGVGALCALGITSVKCIKPPLAGIISTGDEITDYGNTPGIGQIRDVNSVLLGSVLREYGVRIKNYGIVKDNKDEIEKVFNKALCECDMVLLSGGSSKGERDMTAEIISEKGELLFHGLAMKPGKPTIGGKCDGKAVFGLPGHPAAAFFVAKRIVQPFIDFMTSSKRNVVTGKYVLATDIPSNHGRQEVVPIKICDGKIYPVFGKSGLVSLLSASDGYIVIDRNREGAFAGEECEVYFI